MFVIPLVLVYGMAAMNWTGLYLDMKTQRIVQCQNEWHVPLVSCEE